MRIFLLGLPGSGKEELAKRLSRQYDIPVLTLEKTLTEMTAEKSELGRLVKEAALAGKFSDELIMAAVRVRLARDDAKNGFVLEDFPRSVGQAETLEVLLKGLCTPLNAVVKIDIDSDDLMEHLVGRITCQHCGEKYNVYSNPPIVEGMCNVCGERIRRRPDDYEENIANRLRNCEVIMAPLLTFYKGKGNLHHVDGNHPDKKIVKMAMKLLEGLPEPVKPECGDQPELPMDESLLKVLSPPKPVYDEFHPRKRGRPRRKPLPQVAEAEAESKPAEKSDDMKESAKAKAEPNKSSAKAKAAKAKTAKKSEPKSKAVKKAEAEKPASGKKAVSKKVAKKKTATKKAVEKKTVTKKTPVKKAEATKATTKKTAAKKAVTKKPLVKKTPAKKAVAKKSTAKKPLAKKAVAKKVLSKKVAVKKKVVTKKAATKKSSKKKTTKKT